MVVVDVEKTLEERRKLVLIGVALGCLMGLSRKAVANLFTAVE
jgi:hypothetical protein